ncbi:contractile injection system protein, VgrG/Pvc8 family [Paenibacillus sp. IHBB 10380]|uniref:contractile injection system protein, VgrG/Pvc8 family n=1 Tax=Paenibacillus sp. IHBB 10380 TaxID=1566358 RepID=UPI0005CFB159|nr:contractile injection system protein, VgrG/Pvc8 family [Paenibacillus sp. IHBB 10380]AJS61109.1 hypothetical protein UB51_24725 [Paenibacillus sp. IHBB 10380]
MATSPVTYDGLQIVPFEMRLHDVKLVKKIHNHASLTFTGIIPEDKEDSYVRMADEEIPVELLYTDENGKSKRLFHGTILRLHVRVENYVYWLEAEAVSHTYAMDIKQETRSFQNKSLLIKDVMQQISGGYPKGQTFNTFSENKSLGAFTLQYQETDWQFLKRLASHYNSILVPLVTQDSIRVYLGIPESRDIGQIDAINYRVYKDLLAYKNEGGGDNTDLSEQDFICYEVMLDQVLELGDRVTFKGQKLHVFEVQTEMKSSVLTHKYTLCSKKAGYKRKRYNSKLIGASIQGKVMEVVRDEVKIQLDTDQGWSLDTAYLFPYSTMYASEDQTGWYCMPEKGDGVRVYFSNAKEAEGIALSSVRKKLPQEEHSSVSKPSSTSNAQSKNVTTTIVQQEQLQPIIQYDKDLKDDLMANPNTKFILTPSGQKLMFEDDKITIASSKGGPSITLTNAGTIILNSTDKIILQTGKQIELMAESIIMVGNQIDMSTKEGKGRITIDQGQVVLTGAEILMK